MLFYAWRSKIVEYTDSDRVREQEQLRAQDPSQYHQHVQGISAQRPSPQVQSAKVSGKQASDTAGLHASAEARLGQIGGSRELKNWHRVEREKQQFKARRAADAAQTQASFKRPGRGR